MKNSQSQSKFKAFMKKNGYYFLLGACVIAIGVMITVAIASSQSEFVKPSPTPSATVTPKPSTSPSPTPNPSDKPTDVLPTNLLLPVSTATVGTDYMMDGFVFSETLNQWQTHSGIDFITEEAQDVMACYDGTITSVVTNDILNGGIVVISHDGGLESKYMSLAPDITVQVGDKVKKGDVIGKTSQSAYAEFQEGTHLHFEILQNGEYLDPNELFQK